jgi:hypothetical protein
MKVESMDFTFAFKHKQISATCMKFKPAKKIMYRVHIATKNGEDEVFVFYENAKENHWSGLHYLILGRKKKQRR